MDNTNFSDIFKSSFIEKTSSFSLTDSLIGLLVAFLVGLFMLSIKRHFLELYTHIVLIFR